MPWHDPWWKHAALGARTQSLVPGQSPSCQDTALGSRIRSLLAEHSPWCQDMVLGARRQPLVPWHSPWYQHMIVGARTWSLVPGHSPVSNRCRYGIVLMCRYSGGPILVSLPEAEWSWLRILEENQVGLKSATYLSCTQCWTLSSDRQILHKMVCFSPSTFLGAAWERKPYLLCLCWLWNHIGLWKMIFRDGQNKSIE